MATFTEIVAPVPGGRVFEQGVRAGLGDAAPTGRVRLDAIARWLQDVAYADVVDAGVDEAATWVVRRCRLRVDRFPVFGERVELATFCSGLGRAWAERRTTVTGEHGGRVEAVALWVHLDRESLRPVTFSEEEIAVYGASANGREVRARLRHPTPPEDAARRPWRFREADLDVAAHVNNAAYWEPLEEELIAGGDALESLDVEIEYRAAAQPGEATVLRHGDALWIAAADGELHASVRIATTL